MDYFLILVAYLPALALVLTFGFGAIVRLNIRRSEIIKDFSYEPTVTVLLPVFNEGAHVLETIKSILACNYPSEKLNIVAVDDKSKDDSYEYIKQAAIDYSDRVQAFQNLVNEGKHHTLGNAAIHAKGEIFICIDSDCIFHPQVIRELVSCFVEKGIGAVGGRVGVSNPNENLITQCQAFVYYTSFNILKSFENLYRNVICISGCMFAIKRQLFFEIESEMRNRHWFGVGVKDGEDRFMTHLLVTKGYKTYINIDAECWTSVPNNLNQLFMQQLRWKRSGLRDLFWTLRRYKFHTTFITPLRMIHLIAPAYISLVWMVIIPYGLMSAGSFIQRGVPVSCWLAVFFLLGMLYNLWCEIKNPEQKIKHPFLLPALCLWMIVNTFFLTVVALFTFDVGDWGTRNIKEIKP